ncbi:MAG: hypothetical protein NC126_04730 [Clostridium sp.]|nr:hypothetical protein [Clostridium sp.]
MHKKNEENITAFLQNVEVPDIVEKKAAEAFRQIRRTQKLPKNKRRFVLPKAAVIIGCCFLIFGTTTAALGIGSLYRQRMENIDKRTIDDYYALANVGETIAFSRDLTDAERERYLQLIEEYEQNGLFPKTEVPFIKEGKDYTGKGVALDESTLTLYLPNKTLKDEEMLQMIDFQHKMTYSIYAKYQERLLQNDVWRSRMVKMTDEMIDRIYLICCSTTYSESGGYNRNLTKEEEERYEILVREYEEEGRYVDTEITVIQKPEEYTGEGVAICVEDGDYYLPEGEVTEEEFLQIIDMRHKESYALDRIHDEVEMGWRSGYPGHENDDRLPDLTEAEIQKLEQEQQLILEHQKQE